MLWSIDIPILMLVANQNETCSLSIMDKCYGALPPDGTESDTLIEVRILYLYLLYH